MMVPVESREGEGGELPDLPFALNIIGALDLVAFCSHAIARGRTIIMFGGGKVAPDALNGFRLFAHGETFDVDAFQASSKLRPDYVWRRGAQRRYSCVESRHPTSRVEFRLGDGLSIPVEQQEDIALAYLKEHREELRALGRFQGVEVFILALQYRTEFESNVVEICLGPSAQLMWHCLDVGCEPIYYVTLDRLPEPETNGDEPDAAPHRGGI
jgi:hypothetical protein